jgi:PAS domain S-box-containing protein
MVQPLASQIRALVRRVRGGHTRHEVELALTAHRQLLETVVNQMPAAVCLIRGSDLRLQLVNPAYQAIAPGKVMLGKTLDELWPETGQDFAAICRRVLDTGEPHHVADELNMILRQPDGPLEPAYFSWSVHRVQLPGGEGWGLVNTAWETTAHKRTEEALRESERRFREVVESLPQLVWTCRADGPCDYLSPQWVRYTGIPKAPQLGYGWLEQLHPEDRDRTIAAWRATAALGEAFAIEFRIRRHDGAYRWFRTLAVPLRDDAGNIIRWFGSNTDIQDLKEAEQAVRASEARLRQALEAGQVFTFEWNPATDEVVRSPNCRSILGWESDATRDTGSTFFAAIHPGDRDAFVRTVSHLTPQQPAYVATYRYLRRDDGREVVLEETARALFDDAGRMIGLRGLTRDVTEQKRAEEALRESEKRLRLAQVSAGAGIWDWDLGTGKLDWSEELFRLFGLDPQTDEPTFEVWRNAIHPDDRFPAERRIEAAVANHTALASEYRIVLPSGSIRWIHALGQATYDPSGTPLRMSGICIDITDRKHAEEALRQSREDLDRAQEVGQIGSWRLDVRRNVLTWSDENHRIFGIPKGTPLSYETFLGAVHPDDRADVDETWNAGLRGEPYDIEHRIVTDGRIKWVREKAYLEVDDAGSLLGGFGITQDITDRKRAEQQLRESLAEKELLLREIHHRVKNNLQVISSLVSLQADALADPALREVFGEVRDRVRSMALVHEKLYESGGLAKLNFGTYAKSLTQSLWDAHGTAAGRVQLHLEVEPVALTVATAVPCGLILNELVSNALRHAFPAGGGAVTVSLSREPAIGRLCLRVSDNGVGLPPGLDWRQSRSLGLRLVQMLTTQLQGTVETGPGPGTEFRVSFVAKEAEAVPSLVDAMSAPTNEDRP